MMIADYIRAALRSAKYKMIEDENPFFGEVPELPGVWANGQTLEDCRDELEEVIEDWILIALHRGHEIPIIDGLDLNPKMELVDLESD